MHDDHGIFNPRIREMGNGTMNNELSYLENVGNITMALGVRILLALFCGCL